MSNLGLSGSFMRLRVNDLFVDSEIWNKVILFEALIFRMEVLSATGAVADWVTL